MRRLSTLFLLITIQTVSLLAQGFDWQYSARVPTPSPIRFLGAEVMSGWTNQSGPLPYIQTDLGLECCRYENGSGVPLSIGVGGEYWVSGDVAVTGMLGYRSQGANFTTSGDTLPRVGKDAVITQYELTARLHYAVVTAGAKMRLFETHLTLGLGARFMISIGSSSTQTESIIQGSGYSFGNGSQAMALTSTSLNDLKPFVVVPYLQLGYDISVSTGMYLTPTFSIGIPVMSVSSNSTWRMTDLGVGIRLMKGF
ncbi:hypothetical protein BH10BAC6_BH10BAC6_15860 [soil metagenome]